VRQLNGDITPLAPQVAPFPAMSDRQFIRAYHRGLSVVLEVIQGAKREYQSCGWNCQYSRASQRLFPIYRSEEE